MVGQNKTLLDNIMHYGAVLGLFWIFQYLFLIGENFWIHFIYFYHLLSIVSPLLMYVFYLKYRAEDPIKHGGLAISILFISGICFFGGIIESTILYAHYKFIDPNFFSKLITPSLALLEKMPNIAKAPEAEFLQSKTITISIISSKLTWLAFNVVNRVFVGFILSLLIGILTNRRNSTPKS